MSAGGMSWLQIARLGVVQAALGANVVFATSTLNRVMVVELALPAIVPGALVALHYAVQILRPRLGYGSDVGGRRTPWIVGGMAALALGTVAAAASVALMATHVAEGVCLAVAAYALIGGGVGAAGTSLLVLLAKRVDEPRRAAAATIVWIMMIAGFVATAAFAGKFLDPFSKPRLLAVAGALAGLTFLVSLLAVRAVERAADASGAAPARPGPPPSRPAFRAALAEVWAEPRARSFTLFVFVSMLAYGAQELLFEPFAGTAFGMSPGESARLAGMQHAGLLAGMVCVALISGLVPKARSMPAWTICGCAASAVAILLLAGAGLVGETAPLRLLVLSLGFANGTFSVSAIGAMMQLAAAGAKAREGVRMGLWGGAQAVAFALGGVLGTAASDIARRLLHAPGAAYAAVFAVEAALFVLAAAVAVRMFRPPGERSAIRPRIASRPAGASLAIK